ncbi:uncharacterized protein B0J16DRAFT_322552 [Fusarium flagelliforme]|uniref:Uncharacterized protein n=1 Tax=Fusarium flagelliforme TaxID=2675880 RepID=A0A395M6Y7_9HYPO|nr:uncharacterized protein B0J16DRAFT_322552 [Fusarium flagelliforme]KAH7179065.1 hypothetical protein B0J16DRAFT_322552 [Fusarium flagelliforme]RFN43651.1 hypothetical protein FIE12Z_12117 [Fusarium flagelliforme]
MHSLVNTLFWVFLTWASLGLPIIGECQAKVTTGEYSHVIERIWLWDQYDIVTEVYGASKQKILLVQNPGHPWPMKKHVGSGPDGKLTYPEFMSDLEQQLGKPGHTPDYTMQAPDSGPGSPSFVEASDKLISKNWRGIMKVEFITPFEKNKDKNDYVKFLSMVDQKVHAIYAEFGDDPKWKSFLADKQERSRKLLSDITSIRKQETDEWVKNQMTKDIEDKNKKPLFGLGLKETYLVTERVPTAIPGQTGTYEKVNIRETWRQNRDNKAFKADLAKVGIHSRRDLVTWAENLGKEGNVGPNSPQNQTHYASFQIWKTLRERLVATLGGSGTCT